MKKLSLTEFDYIDRQEDCSDNTHTWGYILKIASRYTRDIRQRFLIKKPAETLDFVGCQYLPPFFKKSVRILQSFSNENMQKKKQTR